MAAQVGEKGLVAAEPGKHARLDLAKVGDDEPATLRGGEDGAEVNDVARAGRRRRIEPLAPGIEVERDLEKILKIEAAGAGPASGLFGTEIFQADGGALIGADAPVEGAVGGDRALDAATADEI